MTVRRTTYLGLSLMAFALTIACTGGPTGPGPTLPNPPNLTYTISGVVTELTAGGRVPVQSLTVDELTNHRRATTDANGRYAISGLPAGTAVVQINTGQFETAGRNVFLSGDAVINLDLIRRIRYMLSGFVTEETMAGPLPVAGVDIEVVECPAKPDGGYSLVVTTTDDEGFYSVLGMCDGLTAVFPWKEGYVLPPTADKPCEGDGAECRWVTIEGPTRFDFQLIKK